MKKNNPKNLHRAVNSPIQHPFPEAELKQLAEDSLKFARHKGADQAEIIVSNERGFSVSVRNKEVETLEHHQEKNFVITVYQNKQQGSASTSDLSEAAIRSAIEKACAIAHYSGRDDCAGLADAELLAYDYPELELYHHWDIEPQYAIDKAIQCETIAREQDKRITQCEEVSISTYDYFHVYANSHGFAGCYPASIHSLSCGLVAEENKKMQRDYEYTRSRCADKLDDVIFVATHAAQKTLRRLGARKIKTRQCPVIFEASIAKGLLGTFVSAISGGNLYRKATFLLDHLNKKIFPEHINIYQKPHLIAGLGSCCFDGDGVKTTERDYIKDGVLKSYVLSSYSARKLGMQTTGNSGGVHNLFITHSDKNLVKLIQEMGTGLLVTELMGQGVNILNGNYSRGAFGFWVENGEIQFPVEEITIAGNLKDIFAGIIAVGNDVDKRGNIQTGSILIEKMMVAGD